MSDNIKKDLAQAKKHYQAKKYEESKDLYQTLYHEDPEAFTIWDRRFYSWALYQMYVKNPEDETDLFEAVDTITELLSQEDHSKKDGVCAYTLSMMKLLDYLYKSEDYENIIIWADRLNPDYLSSKTSTFTTNEGREVRMASNKERYYNWLSKSLQETEDFDECLNISRKALDELDSFTNNADIWFKWRAAKSCRELGEYDEAIEYLKDIYKYKQDWFIQWEIAENYFFKGDYDESLDYAVSAALNHGDSDKKIKLYSLLEMLLEDEYPDEAIQHAYLIYSIRLHNEWGIDERLEGKIADAGLDSENTEYWKIERNLKKFWNDLKYSNEEIQYGIISKILPHGKAGFIQCEDGNSYYFRKSEFKGNYDDFHEMTSVSFYITEGFDRSKNQVKKNAVNINTI